MECNDVGDSGRSFHVKSKPNRSRRPNASMGSKVKKKFGRMEGQQIDRGVAGGEE